MNEEYKPINNLWKDSEGYRYFGTLKLSSKIKYDGDDFIQLWEWFNQLQQENKHLDEVNCKLRKTNEQLKDNWNKLKVYIKTEIPEDVFIDTEWFVSILDKMKELEQGSDK